MHSVLALPAILLALTPAAKPLPPPVQKQLKAGGFCVQDAPSRCPACGC